jgi:hypothetical protein
MTTRSTSTIAGTPWPALAGPVMAAFGLVSYFTLFVSLPALRDVPWVNIPLVAIGLGLSVWALTARRSILRWIGAAISTLCAAALLGYVFVLSSMLPDTAGVVAVGDMAPAVTLPDHHGVDTPMVNPGLRTLLVFYRGYW